MKTESHLLLERPEGGSINEIRFESDRVVKSYAGPIDRGYQKLREEYYWLSSLPRHLARHFARPVLYTDNADPRLVELHLARERKVAVAKGVLRGHLSPEQLGEIVRRALRFLVEELYPLRRGRADGRAVYERYHRPRLTLATRHLSTHPRFGEIIEAPELLVNGQSCPSVSSFLVWIEAHAARLVHDAGLTAYHGDAHLDNILTDLAWEREPDLTFIDPRGDMTGPPHYDFAKLLKALEGHYDVIHYGLYSVGQRALGSRCELFLEVERSFDAHYARGLDAALAELPSLAAAEEASIPEFVMATLVAECVHVLSFSFYHAYAPQPDEDRVRAYLAVFALMARRLMAAGEGNAPGLADEPLLAA